MGGGGLDKTTWVKKQKEKCESKEGGEIKGVPFIFHLFNHNRTMKVPNLGRVRAFVARNLSSLRYFREKWTYKGI